LISSITYSTETSEVLKLTTAVTPMDVGLNSTETSEVLKLNSIT